jgi:hypothetical protein
MIITTTPVTAIQTTLLDVKNPLDLSYFGVSEAEVPFACFQGASAAGSLPGNGERAGGGERIIDVLNGFPSFLQSGCYHYKQLNK